MLEGLRRFIGGEGPAAASGPELERVTRERAAAEARLEALRASRWASLFPKGPVPGSGQGRFPGLDPINLEESEPQSWLVSAATGIIDRFPGSATLLSQLDQTFEAFADANYWRVVPGGPHDELCAWTRELLSAWDLELEPPVYLAFGGGARVLGCSRPLVVLDHYALAPLAEQERRFLLATCLGHVFFGNLRIFAFYRLCEMLDKLPSVSGLLLKGLGMIPGVGNTITKGLELARALNDQVVRKTNLVIGQRQHVLCDRLATLTLGTPAPAFGTLAKLTLPAADAGHPRVQDLLVAQGRAVHERFERGEIDLSMLSVLGPHADFAALRAYKLDAWVRDERSRKLAQGYYVTRDRLREYRATHRSIEDELDRAQRAVLALAEQEQRLREDLARAAASATAAAADESAPPATP